MSGPPEQLEAALASFRLRMSASNLAWWTGKIQSLEQESELNDKQRLDYLAQYLGLDRWAETGHPVVSPSQILLPPEHPEHVGLGSPPCSFDGTGPPMPVETRQRFLADLSQEVNEVAGQEIPFPDELSRFLELTDHADGGILRDFMPVSLRGLFLLGICPRDWMSDRLPCRDADWEVMTGCQSALGEGSTQILYSRKTNGNADEAQWKWRVYNIDSKDPDRNEHWFDSIAEFLDFMAGWFDRLPDG